MTEKGEACGDGGDGHGKPLPARRIALVQPFYHYQDASSDRWDPATLERHVAAAEAADLVVFPEIYPWWGPDDARRNDVHRSDPEAYDTVAEAQVRLRGLAVRYQRRIIAGGYFRMDGVLRNAMLFASPAQSQVQVACKRLLWLAAEGEKYTAWPVDQAAVFEDADGRVFLPLICADIYGDRTYAPDCQTPAMQRIVARTRELVAIHPGACVIVCSYAHSPFGVVWRHRLQNLAREAKTDVLYTNFAGQDVEGFGSGGTGLIRPDGTEDRLGNVAGVYWYALAAVKG
jgi:predicted amidohydrolase